MNNLENNLINSKIDVDIPKEWVSLNGQYDVTPKFGFNGFQIFVCDDATRDAEGLWNKYSVTNAEEYAEGNALLHTNDWNEVLSFVNGGDAKENV